MNTLYEYMKIPKSCEVENIIFKKTFYENIDMGKSDKDILTDYIDKAIWKYCLKSETINIKAYRDDVRVYDEIEVIEVKVNKTEKIKRIAELIVRAIPYPVLLVFVHKNKIQLCATHHRVNLSDSSKNTIEEFVFTDWIDTEMLTDKDIQLFERLEFKKLSHQDCYRLYSDIVNQLIIYNASKFIDGYIEGKSANEVKDIYDKVLEIDKQTDGLMALMRKETQMNKKIEMNVAIKKLERKRKELIRRLVE